MESRKRNAEHGFGVERLITKRHGVIELGELFVLSVGLKVAHLQVKIDEAGAARARVRVLFRKTRGTSSAKMPRAGTVAQRLEQGT